MSQLLNERPSITFTRFIELVRDVGVLNVDEISHIARASVDYLRGSKDKREKLACLRELETYWYKRLAEGEPDYRVYDSPLYLAEAWSCWVVYSRAYLRAMTSPNLYPPTGFLDQIGPVDTIADLGCGIGLTTAALSEMFPTARVIGTNIPESLQAKIAGRLACEYGFRIEAEASRPADLVFASEYFEHFPTPIAHLEDVLNTTQPRYLIVANTFTSRSTGHFDLYCVDGKSIDGRKTSRAFSATMTRRGYRKLETRFWNNRPTIWESTR